MTTPIDAWSLAGRPEPWLVVSAIAVFLVARAVRRSDPAGPSHRRVLVAGIGTGAVTIVLGVALAVGRGVGWALPAFAMGFGLILGLIVVDGRRGGGDPSSRRTATLARAALNVTLAAGALLVVNVIAFRHGGLVIDLTQERTHSLSSQSRKQMETLETPVVFHLIHGRSVLARRREDRVAQLLELYRSERPDLVRVERLDRYADLERADELSRRSREMGMMSGGGILIEHGREKSARFATIGNLEMFESDGPDPARGAGVYASSFRGEDAITSALIRLREGRVVKFGFTTGHGEPAFDRPATEGAGIEHWKARLAASGCEAMPINLLAGPVPEDAELVVVAGPREAFKPEEAARLREFADGGKPILACLDGSTPTGLEALLKSFNLELDSGRVVDPRLNLNNRPSFVFCLLEPTLRHPATDGIPGDRAVLIVDGSPIRFVGTKGARDESPASVVSRMVPSAVLRSASSSRVESEPGPEPGFDKEKDQPGPAVTIAAVAESGADAPRPRLVLVASRSAGEDAVVEAEPTNLDVLMNAVGWLRGRGDSVGVPAKTHAALTLVADPGLRWRLILAPTVIAATFLVALGALVHRVRRD